MLYIFFSVHNYELALLCLDVCVRAVVDMKHFNNRFWFACKVAKNFPYFSHFYNLKIFPLGFASNLARVRFWFCGDLQERTQFYKSLYRVILNILFVYFRHNPLNSHHKHGNQKKGKVTIIFFIAHGKVIVIIIWLRL